MPSRPEPAETALRTLPNRSLVPPEQEGKHYALVPRHCDRRKLREQWLALIPEAHEGYVSWEEFERMIDANVPVSGQPGAAKKGAALLAGLLRCRRCASKLTVHYTGHEHDVLRYACHRAWLDKGQPRCVAFGGRGVDAAIAREVLRVVQPAAIEVAILARRKYQEAG